MRGAPKLPNNVTSTFFNTVYLLWKTCFEHGGPKLASCPGRHLTSSRPWRCLPHSTHKTHIWRHLLLYPGLLWKYKGARMRANDFYHEKASRRTKGITKIVYIESFDVQAPSSQCRPRTRKNHNVNETERHRNVPKRRLHWYHLMTTHASAQKYYTIQPRTAAWVRLSGSWQTTISLSL